VTASGEIEVQCVDCDVHPALQNSEELVQYMPARWRRRPVMNFGQATIRSVYVPPNTGRRLDSFPPGGGRPGSDPEMFDRQLLGEAGIDYAIHIPLVSGRSPDPDYEAAVSHAVNEWMAATWLSKYNGHGRYKGSISVPVNNPPAAVREIEKWAGHRHFVQIFVADDCQPPFGNRVYHPIWAAASRHDLPVVIHVQRGAPQVPIGFFSYYLEYHAVTYPLTYAAHLTSLICEGVFEKFPRLRFVLAEGGFAWLGPLIWRLDKNWRLLRAEIPEVRRLPSEYLRDHVRFTSQPMEEPAGQDDLVKILNVLDAEHLLMFSSDYPHWDFDDPSRAFPRVPARVRERIFRHNAIEWYGLPHTRPAAPS